MSLLHIIPIYLPTDSLLSKTLTVELERFFSCRVVMAQPHFDPEVAFDRSRGQYNSTTMLAKLLDEPIAKDDRVLGIVGVDLFIPILTYVFGEAQLDGRAAVVSIYRLDNEHYGLPRDERLLGERLLKEAIHEVGHTVGLLHCNHPTCVMRSSTYVEDIDLKSVQFCTRCRKAITSRQLS
jgi:archaemetzincin